MLTDFEKYFAQRSYEAWAGDGAGGPFLAFIVGEREGAPRLTAEDLKTGHEFRRVLYRAAAGDRRFELQKEEPKAIEQVGPPDHRCWSWWAASCPSAWTPCSARPTSWSSRRRCSTGPSRLGSFQLCPARASRSSTSIRSPPASRSAVH